MKAIKNDPAFRPLWTLVTPPASALLYLATRLKEATTTVVVHDERVAPPPPPPPSSSSSASAAPVTNHRSTVYVNWHQHLPCTMHWHGGFKDRHIMIQQNPYVTPSCLYITPSCVQK
jgi:hypothetical protein